MIILGSLESAYGLPISVNWTLFARCYGWGATSEYRFKIVDFAPTRPVDPKLQVERVAPTNHSSSQKTRLDDLSSGITNLASVSSQSTRLTDGRTVFSSLDRVFIACSAVKKFHSDRITTACFFSQTVAMSQTDAFT